MIVAMLLVLMRVGILMLHWTAIMKPIILYLNHVTVFQTKKVIILSVYHCLINFTLCKLDIINYKLA